MARIGSYYFGGEDANVAEPDVKKSAIACELRSPPPKTCTWVSQDGEWDVIINNQSPYIIASSRDEKTFDDIVGNGIQAMQQALDMFSVQEKVSLLLDSPDDNQIVLYHENKQILKILSYFDLTISTEAKVEIRDAAGNIVEQSHPQPEWHKSFRYYRLSQSALDVYEAYRNLFLGFEALLIDVVPKHKTERDSEWIKRALLQLHKQHDLSGFAPSGHKSPSAYLYGTLYDYMRCNLFHSKQPGSIIPFYQVSPLRVRDAYENLLRLWRHLAGKHLNVSSAGGVITYVGYKAWMDRVFSSEIKIGVTSDESPPKNSDVTLSPKGN
jgi:hypothetical protein